MTTPYPLHKCHTQNCHIKIQKYFINYLLIKNRLFLFPVSFLNIKFYNQFRLKFFIINNRKIENISGFLCDSSVCDASLYNSSTCTPNFSQNYRNNFFPFLAVTLSNSNPISQIQIRTIRFLQFCLCV